jgi:hypothetical protein
MKKARDEGKKTENEISAKQFPALRAFMRSYLHQDFGEEYGSVAEAARTFVDDANDAEVAAVLTEWREFLEMTRGKPLGEINNLMGSKLGSAWNAGSLGDLEVITDALEHKDGN